MSEYINKEGFSFNIDTEPEEYRTDDEKIHFASDLNKFVDVECGRDRTCNDLDCVIYKASKKAIMFIESKIYLDCDES